MIQQGEYGPLYPLQSEEQTATHRCTELQTITRLHGWCVVLIKEETRLVTVHQNLVHIVQVDFSEIEKNYAVMFEDYIEFVFRRNRSNVMLIEKW